MKPTNPQRGYYRGVVLPRCYKHFCEHPDKLLRIVVKALETRAKSGWLTEEFIHETFKMYFKMETTSGKGNKQEMVDYTDDIREFIWDDGKGIDVPPANEPPINQGE